jgi:hypothetical protein
MALSDLQVFTQFAQSAMTEVQDQQIQLFNAASRGALVLRSASNLGDYSEESMWAKISGLVRRRNAYGSGAVSEKNLTMLLDRSVKIAAGTPPVRIDPGMLKWIQKSPEEAGVVIGRQLAEDALADKVNTAMLIGRVAIGAVAALVNDVSGGSGGAEKCTLANLNTTAAKFGDRAQDIAVWLMHSTPLFDLYGQALANSAQLFQFGNVQVREDGFGRAFVVTDSASLRVAGSPVKFHTLGLTPGAIVIEDNGDFTDNVQTDNGDENITRTYQSEWTYQAAINGYAWDKTAGGHSPNDAAIGAAANWDKYATSNKDTAGVVLISQ